MKCESIVVQSFPSSSDISNQQSTSSKSTVCCSLFRQATIRDTSQQHGINCIAAEEVTTIFVVGFPDDMTEREFQNMFTFAPGFEAASLKWHSKGQEGENGVSRPTSTPSSIHKTVTKSQMIGFARFRTRPEAIMAAEVLNGKRADQERPVFIKAEMAKKNLHIKRGTCAASATVSRGTLSSNFDLHKGQVSLSPPPPSLRNVQDYHPHELFSPLPSGLLSPIDSYRPSSFVKDLYCSSAPTYSDCLFELHHGAQENNGLGLVSSSPPRVFSSSAQPRIVNTDSQENGVSVSRNGEPYCHQSRYVAKYSPVPNECVHSPVPPSTDLPRCLSHSNSSCTSRSSSSAVYSHHVVDFRSQALSPQSDTAVDHNPPCNTLYVGNLPPTTEEDELHQLFCKCKAFRRMSFCNKAQGPLCFVEFEDVTSAMLAMKALQGHMLSASVKGGIRLSFSKNPLFTKPSKDQQHTTEGKAVSTYEGIN
ncbi:hypothetical protein BX666DRAFT_2029503 [Dichotomocladium elegans]|nr:hypothetical protein BX666DRAFT_2029503 [Dichotomocladium elegans]